MYSDVTKQDMDRLVQRGLAIGKTVGTLTLYKYKNKVFYDDLWDLDPALLEARGIVFDEDGYIVQRPLPKVFNDGERGRPKVDPNQEVLAAMKVNGFMGAVTMYQGEVIVSTTGALDSPFVRLAESYLRDNPAIVHALDCEHTYIFEICDPDDAHIVDEAPGVYLLAIRDKATGQLASVEEVDHVGFCIQQASEQPVYIPSTLWLTMGEAYSTLASMGSALEGFMIYDREDGAPLTKIKGQSYLAIKAMQRLGKKQADKMFNQPHEFKKRLDEEFYPILDAIVAKWTVDEWVAMKEDARNEAITRTIEEVYFGC